MAIDRDWLRDQVLDELKLIFPTIDSSSDEIDQKIADLPDLRRGFTETGGFVDSNIFQTLNPRNALLDIENTAAFFALVSESYEVSDFPEGAVFQISAAGQVSNNTGSPQNFTWRIRNLTDSTNLVSVVATVPTGETDTQWSLTINGECGQFLSLGWLVSSRLDILGNIIQSQGASGLGTDPQEWELQCQMQIASLDLTMNCFTANILYSSPVG